MFPFTVNEVLGSAAPICRHHHLSAENLERLTALVFLHCSVFDPKGCTIHGSDQEPSVQDRTRDRVSVFTVAAHRSAIDASSDAWSPGRSGLRGSKTTSKEKTGRDLLSNNRRFTRSSLTRPLAPFVQPRSIHNPPYLSEALEVSPLSLVRPTPSERGFLQRSPNRNISFIFIADR